MHHRNTWFDVLDSARRAHSNASIPDASGTLLQELLNPKRPPSLCLTNKPGHNTANMHRRNTWCDVLDASRRALSNAIIPDAIGALLQELLTPKRPPSLFLTNKPGHNTANMHRRSTWFHVLDASR
jgi:hypothetical protein